MGFFKYPKLVTPDMPPRTHDMRKQKGWKGIVTPDIRIWRIGPHPGKMGERHVLMPGKMVEAETYPPIIGYAGTVPRMSTRSILARHGVEVGFGQHQMDKLLSGELPTRVTLLHFGQIPVRLRRGNRIHRVYYPHITDTLRKEEVHARMKRGELQLGNDFKILPNGFLELHVQPVFYRVNPKDIPAIARKNWVSGSKRAAFMEHFQRVRAPVRVPEGTIILSETKPVRLPKDVGMMLESSTDGGSRHIHSLFIDPGFTGPIVLEIQGFEGGKPPDRILARLVKLPSK